ncbi:hypothetical protein [Nocardia cyriacigeorgica]|uniref:hypothetical protein n=1 Tax=Nocardia cyriacigeorgica TaxID=135487 RepID=UPI002455B392|nr:hypothetical protein [Nocardia cyriacigeorgica]
MAGTNTRGGHGKSYRESAHGLPPLGTVHGQAATAELDHDCDRRRRGRPQVQPDPTHIAVSEDRRARRCGYGRSRKFPGRATFTADIHDSHPSRLRTHVAAACSQQPGDVRSEMTGGG